MSYIKINSWGTVVESEGVTDLGIIDLSEPNYSFYLAWVLGTPEGFYLAWVLGTPEGFYLGTDSGCSCPSPFEDYRSLDDFTGPLTAEQVIEELDNLAQPFEYDYSKGDHSETRREKAYDPERLAELITDIQNYAKENHA